MSLVGPRPIVRGELARYGRYCSYYLAIKPGLTGLWQVSGRNDVNYRRRVAIDRFYAVRSTLLMDLGVLLKTVRVVLGGQGAY
jgi:lipopolysaccharide/colanic/teichoic acid biosynthesis glycosyltransferase